MDKQPLDFAKQDQAFGVKRICISNHVGNELPTDKEPLANLGMRGKRPELKRLSTMT